MDPAMTVAFPVVSCTADPKCDGSYERTKQDESLSVL